MRELESMDDVLAYLQRHGTLARAYVQDVDLRPLRDRLLHTDVRNAIFLGCTLDDDLEQHLTDHGALIFPQLPDLPFDPYRAGLYTADELYKNLADGYARTPDARIFRWWRHIGRHRDLASELAMTLHDHAITDALDDLNTRGDDPPTPRSDPLSSPIQVTTTSRIAQMQLIALDFCDPARAARRSVLQQRWAMLRRRWETAPATPLWPRSAVAVACDDIRDLLVDLAATGRLTLSADQRHQCAALAARLDDLALATLANLLRALATHPTAESLLRLQHVTDRAATLAAQDENGQEWTYTGDGSSGPWQST